MKPDEQRTEPPKSATHQTMPKELKPGAKIISAAASLFSQKITSFHSQELLLLLIIITIA